MKNSRLDRAMAVFYFVMCYLMLLMGVATVIISLIELRGAGIIGGSLFAFISIFMLACGYAERFHEQINK